MTEIRRRGLSFSRILSRAECGVDGAAGRRDTESRRDGAHPQPRPGRRSGVRSRSYALPEGEKNGLGLAALYRVQTGALWPGTRDYAGEGGVAAQSCGLGQENVVAALQLTKVWRVFAEFARQGDQPVLDQANKACNLSLG